MKTFPEKLLNTTISIYRKSLAQTDLGDFDNEEELLIYPSIPATVKPNKVAVEYEDSGVFDDQTHSAYFNDPSSGKDIKLEDILVDEKSQMRFIIVGIKRLAPSHVKYNNKTHHVKLSLKLESNEPEVLNKEQVSAKIKVVK
jgi:hypothetical protein